MILKFKQFFEEISGTELVGRHMGPGYPEQPVDNLTNHEIIFSEVTSRLYTYEDYEELYNNYLKSGGSPLQNGFTKDNLEFILSEDR